MNWQKRLIVAGLSLIAIGAVAVGVTRYTAHRQQARLHASLPPPLDQEVKDSGSLRDLRGSQRALIDIADGRPLVLAFLGTNCSTSNLVLPALIGLEQSCRSQGVKFVAIFPNATETADQVAAYAHDQDIPFLILQDVGGEQAQGLGIDRTGTFAVLDASGILRYRGGLIAESRSWSQLSHAEVKDSALEEAIREVVENRWVTTPMTAMEGDPIVAQWRDQPVREVTYTRDVAPILQKRCQTCHRPERSAPFALMDYDDAVRWSAMLKEVVIQRRMPPWHADARYGHFSNDRRMSPDEIQIIADWVDGGMAKGDDKDLPPPVQWASGWTIGKPDVVIQAPKPFRVPATGPQVIDYSTVEKATTDVIFSEDRYIQAAEVLPGQPTVVHHISIYVVWPGAEPPPKNLDGHTGILGWAPGEPAYVFPKGSALWVPKGSTLVFEMHYTPSGVELEDRSSVGLIFAKEPPERRLTLISPGQTDLTIAPHDPHHKSDFSFVFPKDYRLLGLMGHMHPRGKAYTVEAEFPDGRRETLLNVPRYDFYWQTFYWLQEPIAIPRGTRLTQTGWWDNSENNPNNPDPNEQVVQGPASFNEMLTCWMFLESEQ